MVVDHQSLELYEVLKCGDPEAAGAKLCLARKTTKQAMKLTRDLAEELRGQPFRRPVGPHREAVVPPDVECNVSVEGDEATLPPHVREQLFVILRDGVRNVSSHSGAGAA